MNRTQVKSRDKFNLLWVFLFITIISVRFDDSTVHIFQILKKRVCSPVPLIHLLFSKLTLDLCRALFTTQLQNWYSYYNFSFHLPPCNIHLLLVFFLRINLNNGFFGNKLIFFLIQLLLTWRGTWLSTRLSRYICTFTVQGGHQCKLSKISKHLPVHPDYAIS